MNTKHRKAVLLSKAFVYFIVSCSALIVPSRLLAEGCGAVLSQIEFPSGYKLNRQYAQRALEMPETKDTTMALHEAAVYLESLSPSELKQLADVVTSQNLSHLQMQVSPAAHALLMEGLKEVEAKHLRKVQETFKITSSLIMSKLEALEKTTEIKSPEKLLSSNPVAFTRFLSDLRDGALTIFRLPPTLKDYDKLLLEAITKETDLPLSRKFEIAAELSEPQIRSLIRTVPQAFSASREARRRANSIVGNTVSANAMVYSLFIFDAFVKAEKSQITDHDKLSAFVKEELSKYKDNVEEYAFMIRAVDYIFAANKNGEVTTAEVKNAMESKLTLVGLRIRTVVKEKEKEEERIREQSRAPITRAQTPPPLVLRETVKPVQVSGRLIQKNTVVEQEVKPEPVVQKPIEGIDLNLLMTEKPVADKKYYFKSTSGEIHYVVMSPNLIKSFEKRVFDFKPWVRNFLRGQKGGGMKVLRSAHGNTWEVRLGGMGNRIIVEQDKQNNTWKWLDVVDHELINQYVESHGL